MNQILNPVVTAWKKTEELEITWGGPSLDSNLSAIDGDPNLILSDSLLHHGGGLGTLGAKRGFTNFQSIISPVNFLKNWKVTENIPGCVSQCRWPGTLQMMGDSGRQMGAGSLVD